MTTMEPALVLDQVTAAYRRDPVIEGVTGSLGDGGALALIGPNGAGKSTLIKAILGLVPLSRGRIQVLGTDPQLARSQVAYVPQEEALNPEFPVSARDVALMGRYRLTGWLRRPNRAHRAAAMRALEEVGLA